MHITELGLIKETFKLSNKPYFDNQVIPKLHNKGYYLNYRIHPDCICITVGNTVKQRRTVPFRYNTKLFNYKFWESLAKNPMRPIPDDMIKPVNEIGTPPKKLKAEIKKRKKMDKFK